MATGWMQNILLDYIYVIIPCNFLAKAYLNFNIYLTADYSLFYWVCILIMKQIYMKYLTLNNLCPFINHIGPLLSQLDIPRKYVIFSTLGNIKKLTINGFLLSFTSIYMSWSTLYFIVAKKCKVIQLGSLFF